MCDMRIIKSYRLDNGEIRTNENYTIYANRMHEDANDREIGMYHCVATGSFNAFWDGEHWQGEAPISDWVVRGFSTEHSWEVVSFDCHPNHGWAVHGVIDWYVTGSDDSETSTGILKE